MLEVAGKIRTERDHSSGVSADGDENDVGEVDDAGDAELEIQAEHAYDIDEQIDEQSREVELHGVAHAATSLPDATSERMP